MKSPEWSADEEATLRDIYLAGNVPNEIHRLPGRSVAAARRYAHRIGIKQGRAPNWSPDEDAILRIGYAAGTPLKEILKSLPGRTYRGIRSRADHIRLAGQFQGLIGCSYSWVSEAVTQELSAGTPMTSYALADAIGASYPSIRRVIRKMHRNGAYISGWARTRNGYAASWALGDLPDAPKPAPLSVAESCRLYRKHRRIKRGAFDPFAAALGLVKAPIGQPGRLIKHLHDDDSMEIAA